MGREQALRNRSAEPRREPDRGARRRSSKGPGGWAALFAIALVVVALRLAAALPMSGNPVLLHPVLEDAAYQARALEIRDGVDGEQALPRGSGLYPFLAALAPGITQGGTRSLAVVQAVLEGMTAFLLAFWIRKRWGFRAAAAGAILYGLDPMGAFFAARFSPVVPGTLAMVGALILLDRNREEPATADSALFGAVATVGFLLLPLPFLFLIGIRGYRLLTHARGAAARRRWAGALIPVAMLAVIAGMILVHHTTLRDGGPVLGWGGGPALDRAFNPASGGTPRALKPPSWAPEPDLQTEAWEALGREGNHYDLFRFYTLRGLRRGIESPVGTIGVLLTKAAAEIGAWPVPDDLSASFVAARSARVFGYLSFSFAVLLGLGAAGFVLLRGDRARESVTAALVAVGLASLAGMASAASRQAALPLLAALGGVWIAGAGAHASARFRPRVLGILAGTVVLSVVVGLIAPTGALRNPSEDLRLLAGAFEQNSRQSVPILEEAVRANGRNLDARVALAQAYQKDGLLSAASEQLDAAFRADSTHTGTLFSLSALAQARGDKEGALDRMSRLVALRPMNPLYLNQLGMLYVSNGRMPEAQTLFTRALRLKPDYTIAQQNLQLIEGYRQNLEEMLLPPEMRLADNDSTQVLFSEIGSALEVENWKTADSLLAIAERTRPGMVQPHWLRAGYLARRGQIAPAIAELGICARLAPGRPMIVQQLAALLQQAGRDREIEPLVVSSLQAAAGDSVRIRAFEGMLQQVRSPGGAAAR